MSGIRHITKAKCHFFRDDDLSQVLDAETKSTVAKTKSELLRAGDAAERRPAGAGRPFSLGMCTGALAAAFRTRQGLPQQCR